MSRLHLQGAQPDAATMRLYGDVHLMSGRIEPGIGQTDEEIYTALRHALVRYATALVGPSHAEDVVSTVVLRTLSSRSLATLDRPDAYLFRAVLNESRSRLRRKEARELPSEIGQTDDPLFDPTVLEAVMALSTKLRAATYLVYWADRSIEETAHLMGVRPGTIKRYLHDARKALKRRLEALSEQ